MQLWRRITVLLIALCLLVASVMYPVAPLIRVCRMTGLPMPVALSSQAADTASPSMPCCTRKERAHAYHLAFSSTTCCEWRSSQQTSTQPTTVPTTQDDTEVAPFYASVILFTPPLVVMPVRPLLTCGESAPRAPPHRTLSPRAPPFYS